MKISLFIISLNLKIVYEKTDTFVKNCSGTKIENSMKTCEHLAKTKIFQDWKVSEIFYVLKFTRLLSVI